MKKIIVIPVILFLILTGCAKKEKSPEVSATKPASGGPEETVASNAPEGLDSFYFSVKSSLESKDYPEALASVRSLVDQVWDEIPLTLENVLLAKGPDNTYGVYEPAEDDIYAAGETIYLYLEPAGYKIEKNESGYYEFGFSADFQLASESGEILASREKFSELAFKSWKPNKEVAITFNFRFSGLPAGKYKMITTVYDQHSDKKATVETDLTIT